MWFLSSAGSWFLPPLARCGGTGAAASARTPADLVLDSFKDFDHPLVVLEPGGKLDERVAEGEVALHVLSVKIACRDELFELRRVLRRDAALLQHGLRHEEVAPRGVLQIQRRRLFVRHGP